MGPEEIGLELRTNTVSITQRSHPGADYWLTCTAQERAVVQQLQEFKSQTTCKYDAIDNSILGTPYLLN